MDLKKLYGDITALCGIEIPVFKFIALCDVGAREIICRYPKKFTVGKGEYISPETLSSSIALNGAFYQAMLYFILGSEKEDSELLKKSTVAAEDAYRNLWSADAKGKRIRRDVW